jgi:hypothetical protein
MATETKAPSKLKVEVFYNGLTEDFHYVAHERVRTLFAQACEKFGIPPAEREALALYMPDDTTEVNLDTSLEQAGVAPDTKLILRPRRQAGGSGR